MIEMFEDYLSAHPEEALRKERDAKTGAEYFVTGDELVDQWERDIAAGREPDFDAAQSADDRAREAALRARARAEATEALAFEGIDERFDD